MRGHIDMDIVRKQFDDSKKMMENKLTLVRRIAELQAEKETALKSTNKLKEENARLARRLEELEKENNRLREEQSGGSTKK